MILDLFYCGEANICQENSESSLTIAEELQQDLRETLTMENRVPNISEATFKKDQCVSKSVVIPKTSELAPGNFAMQIILQLVLLENQMIFLVT